MAFPRSLAACVDTVARFAPTAAAVAAPQQGIALTYGDLRRQTRAISRKLEQKFKLQTGDVVVSDLPNVYENLLIQIACSRSGFAYASVKNEESLENLRNVVPVKGIFNIDNTNEFLTKTDLPFCSVNELNSILAIDDFLIEDDEDRIDQGEENAPLGYYNSIKPLTNGQALSQGNDAKMKMKLLNDRICVSITLCHAFGIGSAVSSSLLSGSCIVLPAVGGIRGCGVPSQRADVTLDVLASEKCTVLFADTHTLKALPEFGGEYDLNSLRTGVCKIGSGIDFLDEKRMYSGVEFFTLGKKLN